MNNEEKILLLLQKLTDDLNVVKEDMKVLKDELKDVRHEALKTNMRLENGIIPSIQVIKEGQ